MYADKFRKQQRKVLNALTIISANRNVEKLTTNENEEKKAIEEGRAIIDRLMKVYLSLQFVLNNTKYAKLYNMLTYLNYILSITHL